MSEIDYNEIDPGIRHVVKALNDAGYETSDSGDGTKVGMECAVDFAMVAGSLPLGVVGAVALIEGAADEIARVASNVDGKQWKCDASYDSDSREWVWVAYPS